jgi:hypothetical protein
LAIVLAYRPALTFLNTRLAESEVSCSMLAGGRVGAGMGRVSVGSGSAAEDFLDLRPFVDFFFLGGFGGSSSSRLVGSEGGAGVERVASGSGACTSWDSVFSSCWDWLWPLSWESCSSYSSLGGASSIMWWDSSWPSSMIGSGSDGMITGVGCSS